MRRHWTAMIAAAVLTAMAGAALISGCAAFGGGPDEQQQVAIERSPQWRDGRFRNQQPIWSDTAGAWRRLLFGPATPLASPANPVPLVHNDPAVFATPPSSGLRITWFGHSSALVEVDGGRILIDPFWSRRASPVDWAGPQRWYPPPMALGDLPRIDAVLISHDHYDHLDQASIVAMRSWPTVFIVPLGVGAHLRRWGIPDSRIIELDWWQTARAGGLELVATPARHASGRRPTGGNQTLWAGYAIIGTQHRVWYSGDTGFHTDLPRIGERLGPFDATLIEAGQYDPRWPDTHLGPELAVEAHRLVGGKVMIPVHWAALKLAQHAWAEPVERVLVAARCHGVTVLTPRPGESVEPALRTAQRPWWPAVPWQTASQNTVLATRNGDPAERVGVDACRR
jgi:L-ascorbate metabolism protein UlaG (beta-lactamase superfamily)